MGKSSPLSEIQVLYFCFILQKFPEVNAGWDDGIKLFETIDISVAVATERGLITPIVRKANKKGLVGISTTTKVRSKKCLLLDWHNIDAKNVAKFQNTLPFPPLYTV